MIAHLLFYFALLLNPWQQPMGYGGTHPTAGNNIVVQNGCGARNTGSVTSFGLAIFGATNCNATSYVPAINDVIVIMWGLSTNQASITSCSDTNTNTWTISAFSGGNNKTFVSRSKLTTGGNTTVTCSWPTGSAVIGLEIDLSGAQNVLDGATINFQSNSSATSQSTPALTTVNANDIILGCFQIDGSSISTGYTAVAPFTAYAGLSATTQISGYCEYNIVTSTATYTPQFTLSTASSGQTTTLAVESQ
jgi:hypothetical protein